MGNIIEQSLSAPLLDPLPTPWSSINTSTSFEDAARWRQRVADLLVLDSETAGNGILDLISEGYFPEEPSSTLEDTHVDKIPSYVSESIKVIWDNVKSRHDARKILAPSWIYLKSGIRSYWASGDLIIDDGTGRSISNPDKLLNIKTFSAAPSDVESTIEVMRRLRSAKARGVDPVLNDAEKEAFREMKITSRFQKHFGLGVTVADKSEYTVTGVTLYDGTDLPTSMYEHGNRKFGDPFWTNAPSPISIGYALLETLTKITETSLAVELLRLASSDYGWMIAERDAIIHAFDPHARDERDTSPRYAPWKHVTGKSTIFSGR